MEQIYGPFATKQEAHNWAFRHLPEVYRVFDLLAPDAAHQSSRGEKTSGDRS